MSLSVKRCSLPLGMIAFALFVFSGVAHAQFGRLPKLPKKVLENIPSLSDLTGSTPPVSTSLKHASREAPFLDDFNPTTFKRMSKLKRSPSGGFLLPPGLYEFNAESYCLHAGTHEPRSGPGYIYAPLVGSRAGVIKGILRRSYRHPDISDDTIQFLLWAILSRAKFSELRPDLRAAAARLLNAREIAELQTGEVKKYTDEIMQRAIRKAPREVQQVLRAEARLRLMVTDANATFEEAERVAVLLGLPPRDKKEREIPSGRWSLHPEGYFVRYFPYGYDETRVQVYRPAPFVMTRDSKDRIVAMEWAEGIRIEASYNDDVEPLQIPRDPEIRGYAFSSIRFIRPHPRRRGRTETVEVKDQGWTFVGRSNGKGRVKETAWFRPLAPANVAFGFRSPVPNDHFWSGLYDRYQQGRDLRDRANALERWGDRMGGRPSSQSINDLVDADQFRSGIHSIPGGFLDQAVWMVDHYTLMADSFYYIGCAIAGECPLPDGSYMPGSPGEEVPDFDFGEIALPGNRNSQRLGISGRSN